MAMSWGIMSWHVVCHNGFVTLIMPIFYKPAWSLLKWNVFV